MVCDKCEKKQAKLATPSVWKAGTDARKIGGNKLLDKRSKAINLDPYGCKCKNCNSSMHVKGVYCTDCAYKEGRCQMCGKKTLDTKMYKMSMV
eukprot:GDKH01018492.1.p2 GENE.GDKH01018492.1~~GDKH01018492.1.p2  ORF type:complete len:93 (+),score=5.52 GDKH01018492.1:116-394(+)